VPARQRRRFRFLGVPAHAKPLLRLVVAIFFAGTLLGTASNDRVVFPFFAMHARWHVARAFGFVSLSAFNHARFAGPVRESSRGKDADYAGFDGRARRRR